ncbi:MAG: hypothetical protein GXO74_10745 [Calditrichaeota bacterium]|nr:hypothetical protein [Calditrichota bacterium]
MASQPIRISALSVYSASSRLFSPRLPIKSPASTTRRNSLSFSWDLMYAARRATPPLRFPPQPQGARFPVRLVELKIRSEKAFFAGFLSLAITENENNPEKTKTAERRKNLFARSICLSC